MACVDAGVKKGEGSQAGGRRIVRTAGRKQLAAGGEREMEPAGENGRTISRKNRGQIRDPGKSGRSSTLSHHASVRLVPLVVIRSGECR